MRYREQIIDYGNYREVKMFPVFPSPRASHRKPKHKPTRKVQERLNQVNAERALARLIAANFTSNDLKLELTYSSLEYPDSIEQAKKDISNFFRRVKRARARAGLTDELKYIYAFGQGSTGNRIHFHVILSGGLSIQQLAKIWGKGYVDKVLPLMFDEQGVTGIAKYFAQQQSKIVDEFDEPMLVPDLKCKTKRWVSSHNCIKPEPKNYDYKLTKRDVKFYAENSESLRVFEKRYPDFFCSECKPFWNVDNGAYYLQIFLYKKTFTPDISIYSRT
jgi:hypothetical protein